MDTDAAAATVTTDEAAAQLGVSARTIRRWVQRGILPATQIPDGYLLTMRDLADARVLAERRPRLRSRGHGHAANMPDTATVADTPHDVAVNPNARAQLEAIRDEWLQPLVETITRQAERIGRLEAERDGVTSQLLAKDETIAELWQQAEQAEAAVRHDEALALEVGLLRERRDTQQEQLVAKYQVIAVQEETIAELRRWAEAAEAAEAAVRRLQGEVAQVAPAEPAPERPWWARLFGRG